jgi:hypothetical protein
VLGAIFGIALRVNLDSHDELGTKYPLSNLLASIRNIVFVDVTHVPSKTA